MPLQDVLGGGSEGGTPLEDSLEDVCEDGCPLEDDCEYRSPLETPPHFSPSAEQFLHCHCITGHIRGQSLH